MITSVLVLLAAVFVRPLERVSTLDPALAQTAFDARAIQLVYETPLSIDYSARPYALRPGFCELPVVSSNSLTYIFKLAPHVRGGKGPLDVHDMVRCLERLRSPQVVSPSGWVMKDVDTIRALDADNVEIRLKRRVRYFPWLMALYCSAIVGEDGAGSGPYFLESWRKNHEMVFARRSTFSKPDSFSKIRYLVIDDLSTQWLMFLRGELDFLGDVSRDNFDVVVGKDGALAPSLIARGISLYSMPTLESSYIGVNMRDRVLGSNKKLRQALNCAFDFEKWSSFLNGRIVKSDGPVPHGVAERLETPFAYSFNLPLAKKLMAEAGYEGGKDPATGRRLVLTMAIGRATQESRAAGELFASFFEEIGVKLELDFMTWDSFIKTVNDGRVQLYRMTWVGDYPDAQNFMQLFYSPNSSPGVNHSNYSNPEFDAAYEREDFVECQRIVREDCPWVFTHYNKVYSLVGRRVGNYKPTDFPYGAERYYTVREK